MNEFERAVLVRLIRLEAIIESMAEKMDLRVIPEYSKDEDDARRAIEIIESGYTEYYEEAIGHFYKKMPQEDQKLVSETLNMYNLIYTSYLKLNESDQEELRTYYNFYLRGFDGNNEGDKWSYLNFLLKSKNYWNIIKEINAGQTNNKYNSGVEKTGSYQRALEKFKEIANTRQCLAGENYLNWSKEEIKEVLDAFYLSRN